MYKVFRGLTLLSIFLFCFSCTAYKGIPYVKEAGNRPGEISTFELGSNDAVIKPHDELDIHVYSSVPGAAESFNIPVGTHGNISDVQIGGNVYGQFKSYLVDKKGEIIFPILGPLKLSGMTLNQAQNYLVSLIYPRYLAEKPIVNIRFKNFDVTVLGAVSRPGVYSSANGRMSIFEALANAGDMNLTGMRKNVLLLRTEPDGNIKAYRINMQKENVLRDKNLYFMQQGDKIYVQPNKASSNSVNWGGMEALGVSLISIILSAYAIFIK